jgi:hypothetical protein
MVVRKAHALSVAVRIGTVRLSFWRCYHLQTIAHFCSCSPFEATVKHKTKFTVALSESKSRNVHRCCTWTQSWGFRVPKGKTQKSSAFINGLITT